MSSGAMELAVGVCEGAAVLAGCAYLLAGSSAAATLQAWLPLTPPYAAALAALPAAAEARFLAALTRIAPSLAAAAGAGASARDGKVALKAAAFTLAAMWLAKTVQSSASSIRDKGVVQSVLEPIKKLPIVRGIVQKEKEKVYDMLRSQIKARRYPQAAKAADDQSNGEKKSPSKTKGKDKHAMQALAKFNALPSEAWSFDRVMKAVDGISSGDQHYAYGDSKMSGAVYFKSDEHADFQSKVYARFVATNAIHGDSYPSVARMEAEVISMTADLYKQPLADGTKDDADVCGSLTSGGSESILCAMLASRNWWLDRQANAKGAALWLQRHLPWRPTATLAPEMIVADSAHAAYVKAAEYFGLRMVVVPCGHRQGFKLSASAVRSRITSRTAIVVVSAPTYPHGTCDEIEAIGALCGPRGICVHVDACLGGYVIPFAEEAGFSHVPKIHFGMPGLTSMSVDTHKYGLAHKGTSVVLYRTKELRKYQFTRVTEWTGGLYISPTMAGSRSGAVIAAAWASLLTVGREGFVAQTKHLLTLAKRLEDGIRAIPSLQVLGKPEAALVSWAVKDPRTLDIYKVNDAMTKRGYHLASLQRPAGLHMCISPAHTLEMIEGLLVDLAECIAEVKKGPKDDKDGMAPIYGMAESLPDRNIIGDVLVAFQEATLDT